MWCAPKLDAPHATPRRPLRVSGTIQSRARRPPAPPLPLPPPGEPSSAPHRSILWYMAGRPLRGSCLGRQSLGHRKGRGHQGAGGSEWAAGRCLTEPEHPSSPSFGQSSRGPGVHGALHPKESETSPRQMQLMGDLSGKVAPRNSKCGAGGCFQISRAPGSPVILPKSFGRECEPGGGEQGNYLKLLPEGPHFYMTAIHLISTR